MRHLRLCVVVLFFVGCRGEDARLRNEQSTISDSAEQLVEAANSTADSLLIDAGIAYFGVVTERLEWGANKFFAGEHFHGYHQEGRFVDAGTLRPTIFSAGVDLLALTQDGQQLTVTIDSVWPGHDQESYQPSFVMQDGDLSVDESDLFPLLFWQGPVVIHHVETESITPDSAMLETLDTEADTLIAAAILERPEFNRPSSFRLEGWQIDRPVGDHQLVTAWSRVILDSGDSRGSCFIILDMLAGEIVFSTFGHREWHPGSRVMAITPITYFRVDDDPNMYFLAERNHAWEMHDMAIVELETGQTLMRTQ